jgi:hypothetical protein
VTVAGWGFDPGERVTVRVAPLGTAPFAKTVTARATGRLSATFSKRTLGACGGYTVTAHGTKGSRAVLRYLVPAPGCGPPIIP